MRFFRSLGLLLGLCLPAGLTMASTIACEAEYGGRAERIDLTPAADAWSFQTVTLEGRFRFQAQWLPQRAKLKTFLYERRGRAFALLHAAEYPLPTSACPMQDITFGLNKVYASELEREVFYQCWMRCE
jgi:hypothetical protein